METNGGEIYVSYRRNTQRRDGRTYARSRDGGRSFYELGEHPEISGRPVNVGLARHGSGDDNRPEILLFSHPVGVNRRIPGGTGNDHLCEHGRRAHMADLENHRSPTLPLLRPCRYSRGHRALLV